MPLARDLHPEFGYIGNAPAVLRKLGFAAAFVAVGSIAAISSFSMFVSGAPPDDPMTAMALAPDQALNTAAPAAASLPASAAEENAGASRLCGGAITVDCIPSKMHRPHSVPANERPAIAAVAIGHPDKPAVAPAEPAAPVAAAEPSSADSAATPAAAPADAAALETPAPAESVPAPAAAPAPARKARARTNYAHRDRGDSGRSSNRAAPSYSYHSMQAGYARVW